MSHAAGGAVYQGGFAGLQAAALDQTMVGGDEGGAEPCGLGHVHAARNRDQAFYRDTGFFGEGTGAVTRHEGVADLYAFNAVAECCHPTGRLHAGNKRRIGP